MCSTAMTGCKVARLRAGAPLEPGKESHVTTIQRINAFIQRIAGAAEPIPAEIRDQYPHTARPLQRPVVVGYAVWPR